MKRGNHNKIGRLYRCCVPGCDFVPQDKGHNGSLCVISYKCLSIYSYLKIKSFILKIPVCNHNQQVRS